MGPRGWGLGTLTLTRPGFGKVSSCPRGWGLTGVAAAPPPSLTESPGVSPPPRGRVLFVITEVLFVIRIHVFYRILPVFYTFPKTDRILQNTSRTHKNTQEYEHVEECERHIHRKCENTTEYRQNTASRWYSLRIHTEYGGLQNTPQEYRAEYARNTQKNTVFFIVFRIRQRIRYFTCRIPTSIAFAAFARPCGRLLDEGDRARLCVDWVAIPIQGGGDNSGFYLFCFWCLLAFCLALGGCLLTASVGSALPSSLFPCGRLVCLLLLLLQAVGGRSERKKVTHERQGGQHAL